MKAVNLAVEHDRGRGFRHPGIGDLRVAGPIAAVQHIVPQFAVITGALVEAVEPAVVGDDRRPLRHAGRRHLPVAFPKYAVVDIVIERSVGGKALVKAIDLAVQLDRRGRGRHAGIGDRRVALPAVIFGDAAPQPALFGNRLVKYQQIGMASVWHSFPFRSDTRTRHRKSSALHEASDSPKGSIEPTRCGRAIKVNSDI